MNRSWRDLLKQILKKIRNCLFIGLAVVLLEAFFLAIFSSWMNGMGQLGGLIIGVGFFLAFELVVCTAVILAKIDGWNTKKDK